MSETPVPVPLAVPKVKHQHFDHNFIRTAVCELRFPVLFEIDGPKPPLSFAQALRKEYPVVERGEGVMINDPKLSRVTTHTFKAKGGNWSIQLRSSAVSLETHHYTKFDEFRGRINDLITATKTFVDSDFFTRIGIRYTNFIPYEQATVAEAINERLVLPLAKGELGEAEEYTGTARGRVVIDNIDGGYFLQHGIQREEGKAPVYAIDLDFYAFEIELKNTMDVLMKLHERQYDLFRWAVGPRTLESLAKGTK